MINDDGRSIGEMTIDEALGIARERELDLVEVGGGDVPVARLMNYGHERFVRERAARAAHHRVVAHQHVTEVQLRPTIAEHDLLVKVEIARRSLGKGHRVRVVVILHGRLISRPEVGEALLTRFDALLQTQHVVESSVRGERLLTMILRPAH